MKSDIFFPFAFLGRPLLLTSHKYHLKPLIYHQLLTLHFYTLPLLHLMLLARKRDNYGCFPALARLPSHLSMVQSNFMYIKHNHHLLLPLLHSNTHHCNLNSFISIHLHQNPLFSLFFSAKATKSTITPSITIYHFDFYKLYSSLVQGLVVRSLILTHNTINKK